MKLFVEKHLPVKAHFVINIIHETLVTTGSVLTDQQLREIRSNNCIILWSSATILSEFCFSKLAPSSINILCHPQIGETAGSYFQIKFFSQVASLFVCSKNVSKQIMTYKGIWRLKMKPDPVGPRIWEVVGLQASHSPPTPSITTPSPLSQTYLIYPPPLHLTLSTRDTFFLS